MLLQLLVKNCDSRVLVETCPVEGDHDLLFSVACLPLKLVGSLDRESQIQLDYFLRVNCQQLEAF